MVQPCPGAGGGEGLLGLEEPAGHPARQGPGHSLETTLSCVVRTVGQCAQGNLKFKKSPVKTVGEETKFPKVH